MARASKAKITVSLDSRLVEEVDQFVEASREETRSSVIEKALKTWQEVQRRLELESATEEYYASLTPNEKKEDRNWVRLSSSQFIRRRE